MIVREGSIINETEWFDFKECWQSGNTYPLEEIPSHINSSVKDHLISDVPVCIFLSAGIDSLSICNHIKTLVSNWKASISLLRSLKIPLMMSQCLPKSSE